MSTRHVARSVALGGIMAGVMVFSAQNAVPKATKKDVPKVVAKIEAAVSSTEVYLFAVPVSAGVSDKLFAVTWPDGLVKERPVDDGWRWPSLEKNTLSVAQASSDDRAWTLKDGAEWNVTLRSKAGVPYQDVQLVGMFDASHVALIARTDAVVLLAVSRSGDVREVYKANENSAFLRFASGAAWFATFQPGEGIESPPMGPSTLLRVAQDGHPALVVSESQVIVSVVPGSGSQLAYVLDDGSSVAKLDGGHWKGDEKPLLWLDGSGLVVAKGTGIMRLDVKTGVLTPWATLPLAPTMGIREK